MSSRLGIKSTYGNQGSSTHTDISHSTGTSGIDPIDVKEDKGSWSFTDVTSLKDIKGFRAADHFKQASPLDSQDLKKTSTRERLAALEAAQEALASWEKNSGRSVNGSDLNEKTEVRKAVVVPTITFRGPQ